MGHRKTKSEGELIPWTVAKEHLWAYPLMMLRTEARRRAGLEPSGDMQERLGRWLGQLRRDDVVVAYDPSTEDGFTYVPRRAGVDTGLIRQADAETTRRSTRD